MDRLQVGARFQQTRLRNSIKSLPIEQMDLPPLWVLGLSFLGFFCQYQFSMGVFHEFLTKSPTKMYFKKNPFLDNIKLSTHKFNLTFILLFSKLLELNLPNPWVFSLSFRIFPREFWVFPWVLHFLEFEFYSKWRISKPAVNISPKKQQEKPIILVQA